jgi:hypothetical protein
MQIAISPTLIHQSGFVGRSVSKLAVSKYFMIRVHRPLDAGYFKWLLLVIFNSTYPHWKASCSILDLLHN